MKHVRAAVLALTAAAASCGGISVNTDWDPSYDFQATQTFTVLEEAGGQSLDALNDQRVKSAIAFVMEGKGFRQVADTTEADLAVGYQFTSEQRSSFQTVNTGWGGYGYGGYGGWYGPGPSVGVGTSTTTERRYEVGSLLIAVFDTEAREMVFTGTGSGTLDSAQRTPEQMQERIDDAVEQILSDFPPGS